MKIAFLDALSLGNIAGLKKLEQFGDVQYYDYSDREASLLRVSEVEVIVTNKVLIDKQLIDQAPHLKLVCISATGMNNVDLDYAALKGIQVKNVTGYSSASVSQSAIAGLLYLMHKCQYYDNFTKSGNYSRHTLFTHIGPSFHELDRKVFGIIGLGNIGKKTAQIADGFGCKVVYHSTSGKNTKAGYPHLPLEELLQKADIISIHAPLNEHTNNLINFERMQMMKPNAYLLNTGRGQIINENDLAKALNNDLITGAYLDVLEKEPLPSSSPLLQLKNPAKLYISPHIAWSSLESRERLINGICENIEEYLKSKK
jgi:lactate dehydrogenase-like 2-hydroxyacid dehydrogenase